MAANVSDTTLADLVSHHMRRDVARLRVEHTVGEALATLRNAPPPARIVYFYVVGVNDRLVGVIPARALLLSPPETKIADIMMKNAIAIPADATVLDACEFFVLHRLLAFPVVDSDRKLIGAIDVELYTDELHGLEGGQEAGQGKAGQEDDLFQLIGIHLVRARERGPFGAFRIRFPWLMCNLSGGIVAALLSGAFEHELERLVTLALFIPVVLALAESVSIQSLTLTLQMLHGRPLSWRVIAQRLRHESIVGMLLGGVSGLVVGIVALLWLHQPVLAACILGGIGAGVSCAAILGAAVPNLLRRMKLDPRVAAGPIALASADLITLSCYFLMARWLLG
jgi:magnesium transporter